MTLKRVAVGDHLLLGGDNMDLALARVLQQRLEASAIASIPGACTACGISAVSRRRSCSNRRRHRNAQSRYWGRVRSSSAAHQAELAREDLDQVLLEGFFPKVASGVLPARQRHVGFQELGFAVRGRSSRHQAPCAVSVGSGSQQSRGGGHPARPQRIGMSTHILFNGGVMKAAVAARPGGRGVEQLVATRRIRRARGRADPRSSRFGTRRRARRGLLRKGAWRSRRAYPQWRLAHVLHRIESAMPAVPAWKLRSRRSVWFPSAWRKAPRPRFPTESLASSVGEPAEFRFLSSSVRKQDQVGSLLEDWGTDIEELSPLEVTLKLDGQQGTIIPVRLETRVTELGTLEVWCVSRNDTQRWKLELNIREKTTQ